MRALLKCAMWTILLIVALVFIARSASSLPQGVQFMGFQGAYLQVAAGTALVLGSLILDSITLALLSVIMMFVTPYIIRGVVHPLLEISYKVPFGGRVVARSLMSEVVLPLEGLRDSATPYSLILVLASAAPVALLLMRLISGEIRDCVISWLLDRLTRVRSSLDPLIYWASGAMISVALALPVVFNSYYVLYSAGLVIALLVSLLVALSDADVRGLASALSWLSWLSLLIILSLLEPSEEALESGEGVTLGVIRAKLRYGTPLMTWLPTVIKYPKGKCWYWSQSRGLYRLNPLAQVNPHIVITGGSGTGKSRLAMWIARRLYEDYGILFLIIDHHNEYVDIVEEVGGLVVYAEKESVNPLELDGAPPRDRIAQVADSIARVFRLGPLQRATLEEVLEEAYAQAGILLDDPSTWDNPAPTFLTALRALEALLEEGRESRSRLEALIPYLRTLSSSIFRSTTISLSELMSRPSVIALANVPGEHVKTIIAETLLRKIFHYMLSMGHKDRLHHYVIIDEAHRLCRRGVEPSLTARLIMESRKYGVGFIVVTQQPLDIDEAIIANAAIKLSFKIMEPSNLEYASKTFAGFTHSGRLDSVRQALYYLPPRHVMVRDSLVGEPVIVELKTSWR